MMETTKTVTTKTSKIQELEDTYFATKKEYDDTIVYYRKRNKQFTWGSAILSLVLTISYIIWGVTVPEVISFTDHLKVVGSGLTVGLVVFLVGASLAFNYEETGREKRLYRHGKKDNSLSLTLRLTLALRNLIEEKTGLSGIRLEAIDHLVLSRASSVVAYYDGGNAIIEFDRETADVSYKLMPKNEPEPTHTLEDRKNTVSLAYDDYENIKSNVLSAIEGIRAVDPLNGEFTDADKSNLYNTKDNLSSALELINKNIV